MLKSHPELLNISSTSNIELFNIGQKVIEGQRISFDEGVFLYHNADLPFLGTLANFIREKFNSNSAYFIKNIHIEYTNICINKCVFCSFRSKSDKDAWALNADEILSLVQKGVAEGIREVHIVGAIHPDKDLYFWLPILKKIKTQFPHLHIKAFTAAEIDYLISKAGLTLSEGMRLLIDNGLNSIPGGGAEIFDDAIRQKLFPTKIGWKRWLEIHRAAHLAGVSSNATMLYGHIETIENRIFHLDKLRALQDETMGFNAFIPLKYKNQNNDLKDIKETSLSEDLKMYALSRIYLDNFPHIKAYWPMMGKEASLMALDFGADDMDGTINNTTSIYSKAGSSEQKPQMNEEEIISLLNEYRKIPVERDGVYNVIHKWT